MSCLQLTKTLVLITHFLFSLFFPQSLQNLNRASQTGNGDCYQLVNIGTILRTFRLCLTSTSNVTELHNLLSCQLNWTTWPSPSVLRHNLDRVQYQMLPNPDSCLACERKKKKRRTNVKQHPLQVYKSGACVLPEEPHFPLVLEKKQVHSNNDYPAKRQPLWEDSRPENLGSARASLEERGAMSISSLGHSLWHTGKPPMMSGMVWHLHKVPE